MTGALTIEKPTCIATTRAGLPCRRPPVRGGVYCVSHMGVNRDEQGAPFGNQNGRKHGFYSAVLELVLHSPTLPPSLASAFSLARFGPGDFPPPIELTASPARPAVV